MRQLSDCSFIQYCVIVYEFVLLYVFVLFISILYVFVNCICYVLLSITNLTSHDTIQFKIRPSNSRFESQFYYHDCDNQSTVSLAHSPVLHARTKHMEICSLLEKRISANISLYCMFLPDIKGVAYIKPLPPDFCF